jgi:arabinogalactan endo-1,4-beta-galactosidase
MPCLPGKAALRIFWLALLLGAAVAPSALAAPAFATGADASWYTQMVHDAGYVFRTQRGAQEPCLNVLQSAGINAIRLRVWLNPSGGWCNQSDVVAKALAANALGQRVMLDFHFSDTWASGATQTPPAAWAGYGLSQMETAVAGEVTSVLGAIQAGGGSVSWVQLGNEINSGMLFPVGGVFGTGDNSFPNLAGLINAGYAAVKSVFPGALVVIHLSSGENDRLYESFFDSLTAAGAKFDVIGMSAYPYWAGLPWQTEVTDVKATLVDMASRYGVATMVCECGYAESDPADCYSYLGALIAAAKQAGALGVFYWEPECYGNWPAAADGGAYAMGAFTSNGEPSGGMSAFPDSGVAPYVAGPVVPLTVQAGATAVLAAPVSAFPSPTFQWSLGGSPVAGATGPSLLVSGSGASSAGTYTITATNSQGSTSGQVSLSVVDTPNPGRLINLSARALVGTNSGILIAGFAVGGTGTSGSQLLLIRASGPALTPFGVTGVLPDPELRLYRGNSDGTSTLVTTDAGWGGSAPIAAASASVGAFSWGAAATPDSAIVTAQAAGPFSAEVVGSSGDTGVSLAEVYDATPSGAYTPSTPRLVNLSARIGIGTGGSILIAGFVIGGSTAKTVLVRASGPALGAFGVAGLLPDPELQIYRSNGDGTSTLLLTDDGWGGDALVAGVSATVGAFSWGSAATPDSALLATLPPGAYTAEVLGADGDTGIALVEIYDVQ